MSDTFKNFKDLENEFSDSHPLESELLGNHPYIIESLFGSEEVADSLVESSQGKKKRILFFLHPNKNEANKNEELENLIKKVIASFKFNKDDYLVYNGLKELDIIKVARSHQAELIVFFGDFSSYMETLVYQPGEFTEQVYLGDLELSYACLWPAEELNNDPDLKKSAWSLIQHVSQLFS